MGRAGVIMVALAGASSILSPGVARACGGCFHPPEGNPSPVTGHRMAIALSTVETTLWDQIEYEGSPEDFVWVLPIAGTSTVEIAENAFFESLTFHTVLTLEAPPPPRTFCSDPCGEGMLGLAARGDSPPSIDEGGTVTVHHEGTVGPYETATISSEDPSALVTWLRDHDYQVPDAMLPTIAHYVDASMSFVVLRLSPSTNVQRMAPVRVTVPGLQPVFPLRMVAGGVENTVELELFVFAESRIEAQNFGNAEVDRAAVAYDWATGTFDYDARFEDALFAGEGVGTNWVTELAAPAPSSIGEYTSSAPDGSFTTAREDWAVVARALPEPYLTRMRTNLPVAELGQDLELRMSEGGDLAERRIRVTRELNRAPEPVCPTFCATPAGGLEPGGTTSRGRGDDFRCSASAGGSRGAVGLSLMAMALAGVALGRRRRR